MNFKGTFFTDTLYSVSEIVLCLFLIYFDRIWTSCSYVFLYCSCNRTPVSTQSFIFKKGPKGLTWTCESVQLTHWYGNVTLDDKQLYHRLQSLTKINGQKCNFYLFNCPHINVSVTIYVVLFFVFLSTLILRERREVNLSKSMLEIRPWS